MSLDSLTGRATHAARISQGQSPGGLVAATIATTPTAGEPVDVLIGGDATQRTPDCLWTPVVIDGAMFTPARDDPCFVQQARRGEMVVVWWEPGEAREGVTIGDVATAALWEAKGDLAVGTGPGAAIRQAVGADGTFLTASAAAAGGIAWAAMDPTLVALAGLATGANKFPYSTGADTFAQSDFVPRTTYTPTWTSTGTAPSLGNGTLTGSYQRLGGVVDFTITLTFGSTTTPGTGVYNFTLPVTAGATFRWTGQLDVLDSGVQHYNGWWLIAGGGASFAELLWSSTGQTGTAIQGTSPFTFGNLDQITISGRYGV